MKTNITNQCKQSLMVAKGSKNSCQSFSDYTQVFFTFRKINKAIGARTLLLALFLVPLLAVNTNAQLVVDTSAVNANFGIDAGIYSNQLLYGHPFLDNFGNIISPEDTDDWFYKSGGTGLGVIDTTGTQAIIDEIAIDNNYWFTKEISIPPLSVANGYFWIDAIYIRDNNSAGNNNDSSVFTGTSNKNTDNPTVWNVGVGATPQKNDIIDVYAHLKRDGPSPENTLWFFGGISTLSVDDNSYVDFEFFRENVQYSVSNGITNSGPDGGHTAWEFTNDSTSSIGDFIVSVNYTNGATLPDAHIRIWVHVDDVIAGRDIQSGTSVFTFNGVFNKGTDSGDFGYAEIIAPGLNPSAFIFANADGTSLAPPWGTLDTDGLGNINIATHYNPDQFLEIGINLTKLGLDAFFIEKQPGQECDQTLGSMIVKSRSLPSFTSELKDFAGPVQFGSEQEVTVSANKSGDIDCINACVQLFADSVSVGATYLWTGPNGYSDTTQNPLVCEPGEYVICATLSSGCSVCDTINVALDQDLSGFTISGPDDICIDSSYPYSGPAGMDTYSWSISGDGTILGEDKEQTVEVMSGNICGGSFTLSLTITNGICEGTSSATYSIGNTTPIFTFVPPNQTIQCHANIVFGTPIAIDNCNNVNITFSDQSTPPGVCPAVHTRTWTATNDCGITAQASQTITITDTIAPELTVTCTLGDNGNLGCNPSADDIDGALGSGTATDNCGVVAVTFTDGPVSVNGCLHTQTRTFTATDDCGNTASETRTTNWTVDTTDPEIIITCSIDNFGDLGCNPSASDIEEALGSATANNNCGAVTVTSTDGPVSVNGCHHMQTRTFFATDFCGNATSLIRTITWSIDTVDPVIVATGSISNNGDLGCNPSTDDIDEALGSATATDNCGSVTVTSTDGPVSVNGCVHTQTRTFFATDFCGNNSSVSRTINWTVDTIAPEIIAAGSISNNGDLGCNPNANDINEALGSATATNNCGAVTVTASDGPVSVSSSGCGHTQTRTFSLTDFCGNTASTTRTISWTIDTIAPLMTVICPVDNHAHLGCSPSSGDIDEALGYATATDNCGAVNVTSSDGSVSVNGCTHTKTRTFTATDDCGNTEVRTRTINWTVDNIDPVIVATGSIDNNGDLGCNPTADDIDDALGSANATDNCGSVNVTSSDGSVSVNGCVHTQTRTFFATDFCGNSASVSRTINWEVDTIAPVIVATGSIDNNGDLGCNPTADDIDDALGSATTTDNCGAVSVSVTDGAVSIDGCVHTQTRTFFATDFCGNTASVSRTINWTVDTLSPLIIATGSISNNGNLGCNPSITDINAALGSATATNNCGAVTATASDGPVSVSSSGCVHSQTRLFSLTDLCGNSASVSRTISWTVDTLPPEILVFCPVDNNAHLGCNPSAADIDEALGSATAADNCGPVSVITTDGAGSVNGCTHTKTRTFSATDDCGNTEVRTRTINWTVDNIAPEMIVICPIDNYGHLGCSPSAADIDEALGSATATDN